MAIGRLLGDGFYTAVDAIVVNVDTMSARRSGLMTWLHGSFGLLDFVLALVGVVLGCLWLAQDRLLSMPTTLRKQFLLSTAPDVHEA